mgnify:CR=1 FL=1|jgi:V/A-type H+-transporting ATPase subunit K
MVATPFGLASAAESGDNDSIINSDSAKPFAATIAFSVAALSAGFAIAKAGSAGLAAAAERPELKTTAIIITALGEAIAIYGIVIAILILG